MYFSVYEPSGNRHRVRLENSGEPCKDIPKDGEFHMQRTPYRKIRCKGGKTVASSRRPRTESRPDQSPETGTTCVLSVSSLRWIRMNPFCRPNWKTSRVTF